MKCIFCKQPLSDGGNNSEPLTNKPCCNFCNMRIVVPVRFAELRGEKPRVKLFSMDGEPQMPKGLEGMLENVDDIGQLHVKWDNGSSLALNAEVDLFNVF